MLRPNFHTIQTTIFAIAALTMACSLSHGDENKIKAFLNDHCAKCHGSAKQKADRRVDQLPFDLSDEETLGQWQDILDQLNLGDMPPASEPRPAADDLKQVIAQITKQIQAAHAATTDRQSETVLRRLNRREYLNSIRSLFEFDMTMFDPSVSFPEDATFDGFDNQGQSLVTSSYLMEHYIEAAELIIDKAIKTSPRPKAKTIKMRPPFDRTTNAHSGWVTQERRARVNYQSIFQGTKERFGYRPLDDMQGGVDHDGWYNVRIKAYGLHRKHDYPLNLIGTDPEEPIRLALVSGSQDFGTLHLRQSIEKTLAILDLPDDEPEWQTVRIWLDKGFQPRLTYQNGPFFFKGLPAQLHRKFPNQFPIKLNFSNWVDVCQNINTPQIRVNRVEIEGPFYDAWPPSSHQAIFGNEPVGDLNESGRIEKILKSFATKAFRRPVKQSELETLIQIVRDRRAASDTPMESLKVGLAAVLCSPGFLYIEDQPKPNSNQLDEFSLASRLSYFLWSTSPDGELLELAKQAKLSGEETLREQAHRMLRDPKATSLANDFTDRWLHLYKLGEMPPDTRMFQHYYVGELESAMRHETHLFFKHILDQNLSLDNFLDSDFTFVNRPLAHHYGFDLDEFERQLKLSPAQDVSLRPREFGAPHASDVARLPAQGFVKMPITDQRRGGLFGQASVLTVTANGIDTSPVIRGVWVLENILGAATPPPPEGIEPLEPDTRGSVSIRDQLKKHRDNASCAECHRKIDPSGFALESFDAVGRYRSTYFSNKKKLPIDSSGKLPSGEEFEDIVGLKKLLLDRKSQFVHCLTEKMLSYAIGRPLTVRDRPAIDKIVEKMQSENAGLEDLVLEIVQSKPFSEK